MLIYFIFFLPGVNLSLLPLPDELSSRISLSKCVLEVVKGLGYGETISISLSTKPPRFNRPSAVALDKILLRDIFEVGKVTVVTEKPDAYVKCVDCLKKVAGYIIQIRELEEMRPALTLIHSQKHWNPHAYFSVITTSTFEDTNEVLATIVEELAMFKVINVLIFFPKELESTIYNVYTWYPYSAGKCGDDYKVKEIGSCKNGLMSNINLFKNKIPKNLMGCPLKIRTSIIEPFIVSPEPITELENVNLTEGLEIKLMNTIAELRNLSFTYSLTEPPNFYGAYFGKNIFNGSFKDLQDETVDILLGNVISRPETQETFDHISAYYQDSLIICVPHAQRVQDWSKLTADFDTSAMIILFITGFLLTILIIKIAKYQPEESLRYKQFWTAAGSVTRCCFAITIKMPKTWKLRLLILCWVYFSFHTQIAYQSTLVSSMTGHRYEKQIETLDDIAEKGLTLQYYPLCKIFYEALKPSLKKPIIDTVCNGIQKCINRTANEKNYAVCTPKLNMQYLMSNFIDQNSDPQLFCFSNIIASYPIEMLLYKGHPLKNVINELVHRSSQSGFFVKWQSDTFYNSTRNFFKQKLIGKDETGLNLHHLGVVFMSIITGLIISSVVFGFEWLWFYLKMRKEKKKLI